MAENQQKISITTTKVQLTKAPSNASIPNLNQDTAESQDSQGRRSPVTDLLFDIPRSSANGQQSDETRPGERQRPVYHISIVAEMVETHPQTLRMYERMGLLNPQRTRNNVRLYSEDDVDQVRRIQHLTQDLGVNLAGVEVVFKLLREMHQLREELEQEVEEALRQNNK
jgi:MerR family transcriptional regulator/heat shock protein HspR